MKFHPLACSFLMFLLLTSFAAILHAEDSAEVLLQRAMHKQMVDGDLDEAIRLYRQIVEKHPSNRPVAARALVQMGRCYEKSGRDEARKVYERVLRDYADQAALASEARERLSSLQIPPDRPALTLATRRIWSGPAANALGAPSSDGRFVTASDWNTGNLVIYDVDSGETKPVTGKKGWDSPDFAMFSVPSPDGRQLAYAWFHDWNFELRLSRADGNSTRTLITRSYLQPMAWTPDGKGILTLLWEKAETKEVEAAIISATDGTVRLLRNFSSTPIRMAFSPDGKYVAYDLPTEDPLSRDLFALSLENGTDHPLVESPANDTAPVWSPDGSEVLFVSDRRGSPALWSIPVARGRAAGEPKLIKPDIGPIFPIGITRRGTLFYGMLVGMDDIYEVSYDPSSGKVTEPPRRVIERYVGFNQSPVWSPDGISFCYISRRLPTLAGAGRYPPLLIIRDADGKDREIELGSLESFWGPIWTPDGKSILVMGRPHGLSRNSGVYSVDIASGRSREIVPPMDTWVNGITISTDGKILYLSRKLEKTYGLFRRDLASGEEVMLHQTSEHSKLGFTLAISPDGKLLATRVEGRLLLVPTTHGGNTSDLAGEEEGPPAYYGTATFSRDGRHLLFARWSDPEKRAARELSEDLTGIEMWRMPLEGGEPVRIGLKMPHLRHFAISPDGRRFLFTAGQSSEEIWIVENIFGGESSENIAHSKP